MGKVKGKHRLDKFYHLAKEQGYRSRAAYKLTQLDSKYSVLHSSRSILDLCAAPGGWMQVAVNKAPVGSLVVGIDLFPIRPIRGCISVQEDITKPKCRTTIKKLLSENGFKAFDLVLHDGSPNVGGAWAQEATSQNALVIDSVKLATEFLAPKGTFLTKVFRSQDYNAVLYCLRQLFEKVEVTKPVASRSTSAEIYVIGFRYKAPAKIDPRLLDIKHLFQGAVDPPKVHNVIDGKQKKNREGYDEGQTLVREICPAAKFVWSSEPPDEFLCKVTSLSFDDSDSLPLKDHPLTTNEIIILCEDLRVLGKQDFKQLLKWRINIKKALSQVEKTTSDCLNNNQENEKEDKEDGDGDDDEDDGEKLLDEMEDLKRDVERKKKREKKVLAKRLAKDKARKATGMQIDAMQDGYVDNELFSLASIKGKGDLATVDATEDVEGGELIGSDDDADNEADNDSDEDDLDSDEERTRYDEQVEKTIDETYERYVAKTSGSTKQRKRAKEVYSDVLLEGNGEDDIDMNEPEDDSDRDQGDEEANPLVVPIDKDRELTQEEIKQMWFSHDIFNEDIDKGDKGQNSDDDEMQIDVHQQKLSLPKSIKAKEVSNSHALGSQTTQNRSDKIKDDLEVVPAPVTDSSESSSDDDSEGYDTDTKCEVLALAKKMLKKRKREELLDDGYNKRTFDDQHLLPMWFVEDERRHNHPLKPVTKEEIAAERARFKEINARPAKKVAEAKARKKRVAMRNLEKIRKKANTIVEQNDINDRSKRRMIDQLYKKAATPRKPKKELVVAKKGVHVKAGKGKVLVDRRMKKDARQQGMKKKQGKKGRGKDSAKRSGKKGNKVKV
ncbi:uncharacterized protein LOC130798092 [Amaranthus tricolor]|uniref:uncharacterized protein LOC130798092 n=1 Tax=Amaranthus tricolor TaxID=29722 RepID=UPI002586AB69|nr:uncharacterized protein LOC130798092 [Amaranthus tricolor]